ncbi:MAG: hypothetical protein LQ350_003160 [Teloschistes chrysophthalmus]|nr:MAG: hypothetical protein LQ350_003160 [Niorma chrysophthalma]
MSNKKIEQWEVERYWEIFASLSNGSTHLDGNQAASVLKNSQLRDDQLERVWDLADVDSDGKLDFEEFCVAMRIIFDLVNGEYTDVPTTLPQWLVPSSKAHLITAASALRGSPSETLPSPPLSPSNDSDGLKDSFDWYMSPLDRQKYEAIYTANRNPSSGTLAFQSLDALYASLDVPDTDVRSAWNLVNPNADAAIGKDASLAFLHILNNRHEGFRIPRSVPPSLRSSFEQGKIDYRLSSSSSPSPSSSSSHRGGRDDNTSTARKSKFGDTYLSRLGISRDPSALKGTDFSSSSSSSYPSLSTPRSNDNIIQSTDFEESQLKRQLADLEDRIAKIENSTPRSSRSRDGGKPALVKRELEGLVAFKTKEVGVLGQGNGGGGREGGGTREVEGELEGLGELVGGLERHLGDRGRVLEGLRGEVG